MKPASPIHRPEDHVALAKAAASKGCTYIAKGGMCRAEATHRWRWWPLCDEHAKSKHHPDGARVHPL